MRNSDSVDARWTDVLRSRIRLQITVVIAGIVLVAVVALGVAVHSSIIENRVHETQMSADERLQAAVRIYEAAGLLSVDARVDDPTVPTVLRESLQRQGARGTDASGNGIRDVWAAGRSGTVVLSIHHTFPTLDASVRDVDQTLLIAGAVIVALASAVGAASAQSTVATTSAGSAHRPDRRQREGVRVPWLRRGTGSADPEPTSKDASVAAGSKLRLAHVHQRQRLPVHDGWLPTPGTQKAPALRPTLSGG